MVRITIGWQERAGRVPANILVVSTLERIGKKNLPAGVIIGKADYIYTYIYTYMYTYIYINI